MDFNDDAIVMLWAVLILIGFIAWLWHVSKTIDESIPGPIARERRDLNRKIKI